MRQRNRYSETEKETDRQTKYRAREILTDKESESQKKIRPTVNGQMNARLNISFVRVHLSGHNSRVR